MAEINENVLFATQSAVEAESVRQAPKWFLPGQGACCVECGLENDAIFMRADTGERFCDNCRTEWVRKNVCGQGYMSCNNFRENDDRYCPRHDPDYRTTINVYAVTRQFGGHEEGGWWYNWSDCVCTVPARDRDDVQTVIDFLRQRFINEGDISNMAGGVEYHVCAEYEPAQTASRVTPHYE